MSRPPRNDPGALGSPAEKRIRAESPWHLLVRASNLRFPVPECMSGFIGQAMRNGADDLRSPFIAVHHRLKKRTMGR